jgi:predicted dinucleotide-binding enzyme
MKIGVLGTGSVGRTIGTKLIELGHEVTMGSRSATNEHAAEWVASAGSGASQGAFPDAAAFGELLFNCTSGTVSLEVLSAAGEENLSGKVLVDVSNPLDFSKGRPPTLSVCNDDSVGEQIQRAFPEARVVKALNTVNAAIMVDPASIPGEHDIFMCGNDDGAKAQVSELLQGFGWPAERIVDLGDISAARGQEMYLPLWLRLMGAVGPQFNIRVVR